MDPDNFNFDDFMAAALDQVDDPFQNPPTADDAMQGQAFGEQPIEQPQPVNAAPPVEEVMPMDMGRPFGGYNANPYAIPELRNDPAGRLMEAALGQVGQKIGGRYVESGGTDWGQPTEDDRGFRQGPLGGMSQLNPDRVVDYGSTGIDMSGLNPVLRVQNMNGDQMVGKPIRDFNDLSSIPSPSAKMYDANDELMLDENGKQRYWNMPGVDFRRTFGSNLQPTTLENGQSVMYDPFNNMTFGTRNGEPGQLLAGGLGLDGATRQQANYYGWNPTTDARGNPVYYDEAGNRTFIRNRDGSAGRQILDVNRDPRFLDGGRAGGGGQGGSSPYSGPSGGGGSGGGQGGGTDGGGGSVTPPGNVIQQSNSYWYAYDSGTDTVSAFNKATGKIDNTWDRNTYERNSKSLTPASAQDYGSAQLDANRPQPQGNAPLPPAPTATPSPTYSPTTTPTPTEPSRSAPLAPYETGYTARPNADGSMIEIVDYRGQVIDRVPAGNSSYAQAQQQQKFAKYNIG